MTTEIETEVAAHVAESTAVTVLPPRPAPMMAGGKVMAIVPTSMEEVYRLAKAVCEAGMAPKGIDTPAKATIAILTGLELGLTPMSAMQRIAIVGNRPSIWGDAVRALINKSGLEEDFEERIDGDGDSRVAVCRTKRRGETRWREGRFSVADAKQAGLWGKDIWQKYPPRMLQMRARYVLRDTYADVFSGLYIAEELDDFGDDAPRAPRPPAPPAALASAAAAYGMVPAVRPPAPPVAAIEHKPALPKSEPEILFGVTKVADDGSREIVWDDPATAAKSETAAKLESEEVEQAAKIVAPRPPRPPVAKAA